jgi:HSP90 family molecular chaperone
MGMGSVRIRIDPIKHRISFTDNGRGMIEAEIHDYLSTIGRSGIMDGKNWTPERPGLRYNTGHAQALH